jgi:hypothetical protein
MGDESFLAYAGVASRSCLLTTELNARWGNTLGLYLHACVLFEDVLACHLLPMLVRCFHACFPKSSK